MLWAILLFLGFSFPYALTLALMDQPNYSFGHGLYVMESLMQGLLVLRSGCAPKS